MAYDSSNPGRPNTIRLRDLSTGADHLLDDKGRQPGAGGYTSISPDGSRVIFERDCKEGRSKLRAEPFPCGFMVAASGGKPEQVCERCTPRGFSSDGSVVLLQRYDQTDPNKDRIVALDLRTRKERDFLSDPGRPLYHPFFSWDDRWVVFKLLDVSKQSVQIMIAPVRGGLAAGKAEWIAVTDGRYFDDKPQFSAEGTRCISSPGAMDTFAFGPSDWIQRRNTRRAHRSPSSTFTTLRAARAPQRSQISASPATRS